MASRAERVKMIEDTHVKAFNDSSHGKEFREFRETRIAARISNIKSVYTMYLNTIDKRPQQKEELSNLLKEHKAKMEAKMLS